MQANIICSQRPVACTIKVLQPGMSKQEALELADHINKYSKEHNTDPYISVAIGMQESSLTNINRKQKLVQIKQECRDIERKDQACKTKYEITEGFTDIGLFQFHVSTVAARGLSVDKLMTDIKYSVKEHVKFLAEKIKDCEGKQNAWACYHSKTPSFKAKYEKDVLRYYKPTLPLYVD